MKMSTRSFLFAAAAVLTLAAGCTLGNPEAPTPTGPSTYALSVSVTASPDVLPEDGVSQSVIKIVARDANGQPAPNVPLRVDVMSGGVIVEFGVLSARNVTTNSAGEATVVFTAPLSPIQGFDSGTVVEIYATPIGTDFLASNPRGVMIRLVPQSTVTIPGAPIPNFTYSPLSPRVGDRVFFDATSSSDPDGTIVRYRWNYGDGEFEEGPLNNKDYTAAGTYLVTLTVTDNQGKSSSITKTITIG